MNNPQMTNLTGIDGQQQMYMDQPERQQHPLANYQFSQEEIRVLKECSTESFFQRSLPFGTGFGIAAYFGVKHGYLKPNLSYGAIPKVVTSVIVGYFLGKFSYQQKCAEKIMRLPNSKLGEALRLRKSGAMGTLTPDQGFGTGFGLSPFMPNSSDVFSDEHAKSSAFNLDTDRPSQPGLDDIYRPSLDNPTPQVQTDLPLEPLKDKASYEELRRKNREEYTKRHQSTMSKPLPPETPTIIRSREKQQTEVDEFNTMPKGPKNKYGDAWSN